ncbi:unnamed protein product, partial [Ixodes pacificus]
MFLAGAPMEPTETAMPEELGWVMVPNLGGLAGYYIVWRKHDNFAPKCRLARPLALSFPSGVGQVALWTVFNSTMGYAAFLAFRDGGGLQGPARPSVALFAASLGYNWAWPPLFYHFKFYAL